MMVILEYCGGGNLHKALQKDARSAQRRLVCPLLISTTAPREECKNAYKHKLVHNQIRVYIGKMII
jgi:hypothetical protein